MKYDVLGGHLAGGVSYIYKHDYEQFCTLALGGISPFVPQGTANQC